MQSIYLKYIETPLGVLLAGVFENKLCLLDFKDRKGGIDGIIKKIEAACLATPVEGEHPLFETLTLQLKEYFEEKRTSFDIEIQLLGSPFQEKVWCELMQIPYGKTISYKHLAKKMGDVNLTRALAKANGENHIAIIIPCHRVIGSNGDLVGYSGGLQNKEMLLKLEKAEIYAQYSMF